MKSPHMTPRERAEEFYNTLSFQQQEMLKAIVYSEFAINRIWERRGINGESVNYYPIWEELLSLACRE
jgi:hypothetical protein